MAAEILTDFPGHLTALVSAQLWDRKTSPLHVRVRSCWISHSRGGQAILHFEGSDSISDAEKLVGLEVQVPLAERIALPADSYYTSDLIGCEVFQRDGLSVGRVRDLQFAGESIAGTPLLVLDSPKGEILIPLAQDICVRIDTAAKRVDVELPEGLIDLNGPQSRDE